MDFKSSVELLELCRQTQCPISEVMRRRECELGETTRDQVDHRMAKVLEIMRASATQPLKKPSRSMGGLIGGESKKLYDHAARGKAICGDILQRAMTYAMGVAEVNASMGLIVAAPTAGSAGIVPGLLLALQDCYKISDDRLVDALFNAGAVGYLAMRNATVAGAVGGCQAEVGVAAAMAASATVELMGGSAGAVHGRGVHRADESAGSGVRPGGRSGGVPMPEPQRRRGGQRPHRRRAVPQRGKAAHPLRRDAGDHVRRGAAHPHRAAGDRLGRLRGHSLRLRQVQRRLWLNA